MSEEPQAALPEIAAEEAQAELTDYTVYKRLGASAGDQKTREVFERLSEMEHRHYVFWNKLSGKKEIHPNRFTLYFVLILHRIMGASFAIKFLERREATTAKKYESMRPMIPSEDEPSFEEMISDEKGHETAFASEVEGSYVRYISFIVLGLADALVEIAGIHAGSLGIYKSTELTGLAGIVAGAAASLAMASAAYAQAKQGFQGSTGLAAAYTGGSYFVAAVILAFPYFLTHSMVAAILTSVILGVVIIGFVSWYNSVMSASNFKRDFAELAGIMLGATLALYIFGSVIRLVFGISV